VRFSSLQFSALLLAACSSASLPTGVGEGMGSESFARAYHRGPEVLYSAAGTRRFAEPILAAVDAEAALELLRLADRHDRDEATLARFEDELRAAGFGAQEGCELRVELRSATAANVLPPLIAVIAGAERPDEVVVLVAPVQEPGADDERSGWAGLVEGARTLKRLIDGGVIPRPRRSIACVWGEDHLASVAFLGTTERRPVAAISVGRLGRSRGETDALCLLERGPDPGALTPLPPDRDPPHGPPAVVPFTLIPNGLSVILRCALVDVGVAAAGWATDEHPWEGGGARLAFLIEGVPAARLWHLQDSADRPSLDRLETFDVEELRRSVAALLTGAMGVADARPEDMVRYLESSLSECHERQGAVVQEGAPEEVGYQWAEWRDGARLWLRALCWGETPPDRYGS